MKITIKFINDSKITVEDIDSNKKIIELKNIIYKHYQNIKEEEYKIENQKLVFKGKILENNKNIGDYNIKYNDVLYCILPKKKRISETQQQILEEEITNSSLENDTTNTNPNDFGLDQESIQNIYNSINQNPDLLNMSLKMIQNPEISKLIMSVVKNPSLLNESSFLNKLTSNSQYSDFLKDFINNQSLNNQFRNSSESESDYEEEEDS